MTQTIRDLRERLESVYTIEAEPHKALALIRTLSEQVAMAIMALEECDELFATIRNDWSDPRSECREGRSVASTTLAALSPDRPVEGL